MDRDEILAAVKAERLSLATFLDGLDRREWKARSLCTEWTVHQVVAHLTLSTRMPSLRAVMGRVIRVRGDINRVFADLAREQAAEFGPAELVAQLRETAGSPRRLPVSSPWDPLVDLLMHGQDIARPLGRVRDMPTDRVVPALTHVWASSFYGARKRFDGLRFVATDAEWSGGEGPHEVRGPVDDLLLLAAGRTPGLERLSGPGVERVTSITLVPRGAR